MTPRCRTSGAPLFEKGGPLSSGLSACAVPRARRERRPRADNLKRKSQRGEQDLRLHLHLQFFIDRPSCVTCYMYMQQADALRFLHHLTLRRTLSRVLLVAEISVRVATPLGGAKA